MSRKRRDEERPLSGQQLRVLEDVLGEVGRVRPHRDQRGPALKKPLLLLQILALMGDGGVSQNVFPYERVEEGLDKLIRIFGGRPTRSGARPEQPFYHLQSSPWWHLHDLPPELASDRNLSAKRLRRSWASLDPDMYALLSESVVARARVADQILNQWWPETIHADIRSYLALPELVDAVVPPAVGAVRKRKFTMDVLANFRYTCAFCGFSALLNETPFGIDAAHIRWFTQGGPDEPSNGLALCKLHHWAFDRGVLGLGQDLVIAVSPTFVCQDPGSVALFEKLHGRSIEERSKVRPSELHIQWHREFVFIGEG